MIKKFETTPTRKKTLPQIDHLAIAVRDLDKTVAIFEAMGFKKKWHRDRIGDEQSAMKTTVMKWGDAEFALMEPLDGKGQRSQISEFLLRYGDGILQHPAIEVRDLRKVVVRLEKNGFKFLTPILLAEDKAGKLLQIFTYPLSPGGKPFFELNQRIIGGKSTLARTFADKNVKGLWQYVAEAINKGWFFRIDIFGNLCEEYPCPEIVQLLKFLVATTPDLSLGKLQAMIIESLILMKKRGELQGSQELKDVLDLLQNPLPS